jgi:hypothetical protein
MRRRLALTTLLCIALGLGVHAARAAEAPAKPVKIETAGGKKAPVTFEHGKHADLKCEACHHAANNPAGERRCTQCHKLADDPATKAPKIDTVMHGKDKGVCFACHRAENAKRKLKCGDCHKS